MWLASILACAHQAPGPPAPVVAPFEPPHDPVLLPPASAAPAAPPEPPAAPAPAPAGPARPLSDAEKQALKATVTAYAGQIQYCYEEVLVDDPTLVGRIELAWTVAGGRAVSTAVVEDTTGNPALARCMVLKSGRWTFPPELEGECRWPFLFEQQTR